MRKLPLLIVALALAMFTFAGCGSDTLIPDLVIATAASDLIDPAQPFQAIASFSKNCRRLSRPASWPP